ncbi:MAG: NAD-dependent epimerase/dehydratase family protein [Hyphomonadaceae bacterium]|nr:NAD-dependent epimerase/dehydratase family protein [Hyphomonadaceae bacterium]
MTHAQTHVVLGAGALGRATAAALAKAGKPTVLVNRSGKHPDAPSGVTMAAGDLSAPASLAAIVKDAEAIYFCVQPPYHRWAEEFPPLQNAAIALATQAGARLIVGDNLYGYGPVRAPMTETMPLRPNTRKGAVRAAMHERFMEAHQSGAVQVAVARASDFFGPFVTNSAVGGRAFTAIVAGKAADYFGDADTRHSYTFVEDFGAAMAILGDDPRALGEVWHVPNAPAVTTRQFFALAFRHAEHKPKLRRLGDLQLSVLGAIIPAVKELREMQYEFDAPFLVDHTKFAATFGDIATPLEAAIARTVAWTKTRAR